MNSNPKISVIVPVYKVEKYLDKCVESIVNQTYKNLEIILVDDGSPDNCPAMCDEWAEKDERIRVIHNKENGGVSSARNAALEVATGDYIGFVDSDDWIDSDMYEALVDVLVKTGSGISGCFYKTVTGDLVNVIKSDFDLKVFTSDEYLVEHYSKNVLYFSCCTKLFSRDLISGINFHPEAGLCEDGVFIYEVCKRSNQVTIINRPLYNYRTNEDSLMHSKKTLCGFVGHLSANYEILKNEYNNQMLIEPIAKCYADAIINAVAQYVKHNFTKSKEYIDIKKIISDSYKTVIQINIPVKRKLQLTLLRFIPCLHEMLLKVYYKK